MLFFVLACASDPAPAPAPAAPPAAEKKPAAEVKQGRVIKSADLKADQEANKVPVLIDVRTADEFASGHVPGAKSIPIDQLDGRVAELEGYTAGEV